MTNDISFEKAPLIEIVAELKWLPVGMAQPQQTELTIGGTDPDQFFLTFGRRPEIASYSHAEKLIPSGFPTIWHQVAWRFRDPKTDGVLLQIGAGIFSANGLQPYKRWKAFRPTVENGIKALLSSRPPSEKDQPFTGLNLRYINGFTSELMAGESPPSFIRNVLHFKVDPPAAIAERQTPNELGNTAVNLLIPIANTSKVMKVQVGDGAVAGTPAVMLDMSVFENAPVTPTLDAVMASLDSSRNIIHQTFLKMTAEISDRMKPIDGEPHVAG